MMPKQYIEEAAAKVRTMMYQEDGSVKPFLDISNLFVDVLMTTAGTFSVECGPRTTPQDALDSGRVGAWISVGGQAFDVLIGTDLCLVTESELSYAGIEEGADEQG